MDRFSNRRHHNPHAHVIHEGAGWIKHGRILCLTHRQLCSIVHRDVLDSRQRATDGRSRNDADIAHMTDVKNTNTGTYRLVFGD